MKATTTSSTRVTLSYNEDGPNNYSDWLEFLVDDLGPKYGHLARVLKTHTKYIVPNVVEGDYMPEEERDDDGEIIAHGIGAPAKAELKLGAMKERNKTVAALKRDEPRFYADIWATIGDASREKISSHAQYAAAFEACDPHLLLSISRRSHLTEIARGGAPMTVMNNLNAEKIFLR